MMKLQPLKSFNKLKKNNLKLFVLFNLCFFVMACSLSDVKQIGDAVSGPVASIQRKSPEGFYVLNSSASSEYANGSIQFYERSSTQTALKASVSVDRLGTTLALSLDQKVMAASYSGETRKVVFYEMNSAFEPDISKSVEIDLTDFGTISQLHFFSPSAAKTNEYFIHALSGVGTGSAKVVVLKLQLETRQIEKVLSIPDDIPLKSKSAAFAYSVPFYHAETDLLVMLPQLVRNGRIPKREDIPSILAKPEQWAGIEDLRSISLLAIDMSEFLTKKQLQNAVIYHPVIYINDKEKSKDVDYQASYYKSIAVNQNKCFDASGISQSEDLQKQDALLVEFLNSGSVSGDVIRLRDLSALKTKMSSVIKETTDTTDYRKRIVTNILSFTKFSDAEQASELAGIESLVTDIKIAQVGTQCRPFWMRVESLDRIVDGKERSFFQLHGGSPSHEIFTFSDLSRSSMIFALNNNLMNTFSFSENSNNSVKLSIKADLSQVEFSNSSEIIAQPSR